MKKLTTDKIRKEWLDFFKKNKHYILESQSLVPVNDSSLLWINSGIATLKRYFSGIDSPISNRLANSQRCVRTNDIENVGVTSRHHTFFEMLGNFSIGDYFKKEAIKYAYDFLVKKLEIPKSKLYITVFKDDDEAYDAWVKIGISKKNIIKCDKERNFWDIGSGPCGPCTEIYYDRGKKFDPKDQGIKLFEKDLENDRYVEIWNIVFSEFNNDGKGNLSPLSRKNIDTGAGLERLASIFQGVPTDFDTDTFKPIILAINKFAKESYDEKAYFGKSKKQKGINKNYIIIADHLKAATFMIADGVYPSGKDRGYVLRRLIRRAIVSWKILGIKEDIFKDIIQAIIKAMKSYYPYLVKKEKEIIEVLTKEYDSFSHTISECRDLFINALQLKKIDGKTLFNLVDTHGFPLEIIKEMEKNDNSKDTKKDNLEIITSLFDLSKSKELKNIKALEIDFKAFNKAFQKHREVSKADKKKVGLEVQNQELVDLKVPSQFLYNTSSLLGEVVALFDKDFKKVNQLKNEDGYVVLNETCFYATSGGQIFDKGTINEANVIDVFKGPNGQHIHKVEHADLKMKESYFASINVKDRARIAANHTTEHLLHSALKAILDPNIKQEGAFKSPEKLTFDFQFNRKPTEEEIIKIEEWIKDKIDQDIKIDVLMMPLEEAKAIGAIAYFEDKYKKIDGDLRVIKMGEYSTELCGGTHLSRTKTIQDFKIVNLTSKGSNSWRIEAITTDYNIKKFLLDLIEKSAENVNRMMKEYKQMNIRSIKFIDTLSLFKECLLEPKKYFNKITKIEAELKTTFDLLKNEYEKNREGTLIKSLKEKFDAKILYLEGIIIKNVNAKTINHSLTELIHEYPEKTFFVINILEDKIQYFGAQNEKNTKRDVNEIIQKMNKISNGRGGGKINFAQGGTNDLSSLEKLKSVILVGLNKN
ncbi:MAG: alanine--tRNA ligase [Mycoplasmoidaceae bacterium]